MKFTLKIIITALFTLAALWAYDAELYGARKSLPKKLFEQGRYTDALYEYKALENYISATEKHIVYFWKGNCYMKLKRYDEAAVEYQKLVRDPFSDRSFKKMGYYNMVILYHAKGDAAKTEERADFFARYFPESKYAERAQFYKANVYLTLERYEEANERFKRYLEKYPNGSKSSEARMKRAIIQKMLDAVNGESVTFNEMLKDKEEEKEEPVKSEKEIEDSAAEEEGAETEEETKAVSEEELEEIKRRREELEKQKEEQEKLKEELEKEKKKVEKKLKELEDKIAEAEEAKELFTKKAEELKQLKDKLVNFEKELKEKEEIIGKTKKLYEELKQKEKEYNEALNKRD